MLRSITRRAVSLPQAPTRLLPHLLSVLAFGWLLAQDLIQPIAIYLLELYLAF